jgi:hypothetical protein
MTDRNIYDHTPDIPSFPRRDVAKAAFRCCLRGGYTFGGGYRKESEPRKSSLWDDHAFSALAHSYDNYSSVDRYIKSLQEEWRQNEVARKVWNPAHLTDFVRSIGAEDLLTLVKSLPMMALPSEEVARAMMGLGMDTLLSFLSAVGPQTWTPDHTLEYSSSLSLERLMHLIRNAPINQIHPLMFLKVVQVPLAFKEALTVWDANSKRGLLIFLQKNPKDKRVLQGIIQAGKITSDESWHPILTRIVAQAGGKWVQAASEWSPAKRRAK